MSPAISDPHRPPDDDGAGHDIGRSAGLSPAGVSESGDGESGVSGTLNSAGAPSPPSAPRPGRALRAGVAAVLVLTVLGAPLGLLWAALAPSVPVVKTEDGIVVAQPQPEQFIAADAWFSGLGFGFGVLAAVAGWLVLRRHRGPIGLGMVAVGGVGAALVAWRLGRQVGLAEYQRLVHSAPVGEMFSKPPDLRAGRFEWLYGVLPTVQGDLLLPAFGAVVTYALLAGWSRHPTLQPEPEPEPQASAVSWDSPAPPAPGAAPAPPAPGAAAPPPD